MIKISKAQESRIEAVFRAEKPFCTVGDEQSVGFLQGLCAAMAEDDLVELIDDESNVRVGYLHRKHIDRIVDLLNAAASEGQKK